MNDKIVVKRRRSRPQSSTETNDKFEFESQAIKSIESSQAATNQTTDMTHTAVSPGGTKRARASLNNQQSPDSSSSTDSQDEKQRSNKRSKPELQVTSSSNSSQALPVSFARRLASNEMMNVNQHYENYDIFCVVVHQ
jgi:hypothetical protein